MGLYTGPSFSNDDIRANTFSNWRTLPAASRRAEQVLDLAYSFQEVSAFSR